MQGLKPQSWGTDVFFGPAEAVPCYKTRECYTGRNFLLPDGARM